MKNLWLDVGVIWQCCPRLSCVLQFLLYHLSAAVKWRTDRQASHYLYNWHRSYMWAQPLLFPQQFTWWHKSALFYWSLETVGVINLCEIIHLILEKHWTFKKNQEIVNIVLFYISCRFSDLMVILLEDISV